MRRRPEAYHEALRAHPDAPVGDLVTTPADAPASIHDTFRVKEVGLVDHLVYDAFERRSGLVRALPLEASVTDWAMARATELGDAVDGAFTLVDLRPGCLVARRAATIADATVLVTKTLTLGGDRRAPTLALEVALDHRDGPPIEARIGVEWSMTMLGGGGNPSAWWDLRGKRTGHDQAGSATDLSTIAQGNDYIGISVTTTTSAADAWWAPIETVSNSENGFERVYQGAGLFLSWPTRLARGDHWTQTISHMVATTHDQGRDRS
jgi:alpha-amylase